MRRAAAWTLIALAVAALAAGALAVTYLEVVAPDGDSHPLGGAGPAARSLTSVIYGLAVLAAVVALLAAAAAVAGRPLGRVGVVLGVLIVLAAGARVGGSRLPVDDGVQLVPTAPATSVMFHWHRESALFALRWWFFVGTLAAVVVAAAVILVALRFPPKRGRMALGPHAIAPAWVDVLAMPLLGAGVGAVSALFWCRAARLDQPCTTDTTPFCTTPGAHGTGAAAGAVALAAALAVAVVFLASELFGSARRLVVLLLAPLGGVACFVFLLKYASFDEGGHLLCPPIWQGAAGVAAAFLLATVLGLLQPRFMKTGTP